MSFSSYFQNEFRSDFNELIEGARTMGEYGNHAVLPQPALQAITVGTQNPTVKSWSESKRDDFAVALFYTVLVDQICYSNFGSYYKHFRELTMYPKNVGNCLSACSYHSHPSEILKHVGTSVTPSQIEKRRKMVLEAVPTIEKEILSFCERYMPELDGAIFWESCLQHIKPYQNINH